MLITNIIAKVHPNRKDIIEKLQRLACSAANPIVLQRTVHAILASSIGDRIFPAHSWEHAVWTAFRAADEVICPVPEESFPDETLPEETD